MQFTPAQQRAIHHSAGNLQLVACAGAGKTEVLARRVAHLLGPGPQQVAPDQVVAFTFTERAANELRGRIRERVRSAHGVVPGLDALFVGTMHGFCLSLLHRHRPEFLKCVVLNQVQQYMLLDRHSRESGLTEAVDLRGAGLRRFTDTRPYAEAMNLFREATLVQSELAGNTVYAGLVDYQDLLRRRAFIDFAGVIAEAVALLESDVRVREWVAARLRHLIVDEYQDSNPIQERLVRVLHGLGATLCVVGDDDQTIYQFRGSDVRNIQTFAERYPDVTTITLDENFRSSEAVVALGRLVVGPARERLPKEMRAVHAQRFDVGDITAVELPSADDEAEHIAAHMLALRGVAFTEGTTTRGLDWSDMAVLCRSVKAIGHPIVEALARHGIPAVVVGMSGLFDAPEAAAARALFRYLGGHVDLTFDLLRDAWRNAALGVAEANLAAALEYARETQRRILSEPYGGGTRHEHYGLQRFFWNFLARAGVRESLVPAGRGEVVFYNLGRFSQIISDFEVVNFHTPPASKYPNFADFLRYRAETAYGEGAPDEVATAPNAVRIMTVHQAKGLQWPVVFIPGLGRNRFPAAAVGGRSVWHLVPENAVARQSRFEGGEDDERRLMYVAVTRSQKFLHLSWAPTVEGVRSRYREASVFFNELRMSAWVRPSAESFENRCRLEPRSRQSARQRTIGYSDFQRFLDCPYAYKLRVLCGFNPPLHEALGYGQSLHNLLFEVHERWQRGDRIGEDAVPDLVDGHLHLPYAFGDLRASLRAAAIEAVRGYLADATGAAHLVRSAEHALSLDVTPDLQLTGRLDLLRVGTDGRGEIVDFKTSNGAASDDAVQTQLRVYAAALAAGGDGLPGRITVHDLANRRRRSETLDPGELPPLLPHLRSAAERLERGEFDRCSDPNRCERCDLRKLCPGAANASVLQAA